MGWNDLLLRLRALARHGHAERELDEELNFHLEMEASKKRSAGMPDADARRGARAEFGGLEQVREQCRDVRGVTLLENLARDFLYGVRVLRKTPAFTAIAVLSLAIGIGANTAVFSLLNTVLFRMLPVREPEQLVVARWGAHKDLDLAFTWASGGGDGHGGWTTNVVSWPIFTELRARSRTLSAVMGFSPLGPLNVAANGQAFSTGGMVVSGNYFSALGVGTVVGRPIAEDDDTSDGVTSAVISHRFWERVFALDPGAIGKTLYVNGQPCVVIGVAPRQFFGVSAGGFMRTPQVDIMLPIRAKERLEGVGKRAVYFGDSLFWIQVMGRLEGASAEAAQTELAAIVGANLPEPARRAMGSDSPRIFLERGSRGLDSLRRAYQEPLLILMAIVGVVLLMACANLAALLLARATARQKEILLRLAVGAGRMRLVRQLLVEGAVLSAAGMAAGLAFAYWGVRNLLALMASGQDPLAVEVVPDARVLGFTAAVALATTFLFALAPAVRATRVDVASGLKEDLPAVPGMRRFSASRVLVAVQMAVALVLLAGAVLFIRSLLNLRSVPLGFNARGVVVFGLAPGKNGYDEIRGSQLYTRVLDRLKQTPGVAGVSLSAERLISGWMSNGTILIDGAGKPRSSTLNFVGPDFFQVMQIPLVAGRGIEARDMAATQGVAVINETVARRYFGSGAPVGRRFRWSRRNWDVEVIGVAKDARYYRLRGDVPATIYAPYTQRPFGWPQEMNFEVRTAGNPAAAIAGIRRAVAEVDRMLPLIDLKTQEAQIDDSLAQERLFASLVSLFGAITLVLACVGLYGLVAYSVSTRTREIGVRMALGAGRAAVLRMLLGQVAATTAAGLTAGLLLTVALTRIIASRLYGVKPADPLSLLAAAAAVTAVAIAAACVPARRALRIDPVGALRHE